MSAFDREKARQVLAEHLDSILLPEEVGDGLLDALAGCVTDEPPTIDRDAIHRVVSFSRLDDDDDETVDKILALLRPAPAQTIDRDALKDLLEVVLPTHAELSARGTSLDVIVSAVLALLRPDPRIAKLEALEPTYVDAWDGEAFEADEVRAVLRGEP